MSSALYGSEPIEIRCPCHGSGSRPQLPVQRATKAATWPAANVPRSATARWPMATPQHPYQQSARAIRPWLDHSLVLQNGIADRLTPRDDCLRRIPARESFYALVSRTVRAEYLLSGVTGCQERILDYLYCLRCNQELEPGQKSVAVYMFAQTVGIRPRQKSGAQRICFCPPCSVSLAMGPPPPPLPPSVKAVWRRRWGKSLNHQRFLRRADRDDHADYFHPDSKTGIGNHQRGRYATIHCDRDFREWIHRRPDHVGDVEVLENQGRDHQCSRAGEGRRIRYNHDHCDGHGS